MKQTTSPLLRFGASFTLALGASLLLAGCPAGADLDDSQLDSSNGGGECDVSPILYYYCSGSICHESTSTTPVPSGGVDFFAPGFEAHLMDAPATYPDVENPQDCPSTPELLIDTTNPQASLILTKLNGGYSCGDDMPSVGAPPSADEMACIESWVMNLVANPPTGSGSGGASGSGGSASGGAASGGSTSDGGSSSTGGSDAGTGGGL